MFILKAVSQLQIIEEVASQYGLAALMQEKPFAVSHITLHRIYPSLSPSSSNYLLHQLYCDIKYKESVYYHFNSTLFDLIRLFN